MLLKVEHFTYHNHAIDGVCMYENPEADKAVAAYYKNKRKF